METMYPPRENSPTTLTNGAILSTDTSIEVADASVFPTAPNIATIGVDVDSETIIYTGISGNILTGVTRGVEGAAKDWPSGTFIYRAFTAMDLSAVQTNITEIISELLGKTNTDAFTPTGDYQPATKKYVDDNIGGSSNDENAIHTDSAAEIHGITLKSSLSGSEEVVVEDDQDSWNKKRVKLSTIQDYDIDGGSPSSVYTSAQVIDGGSP
jgi:hypothetical protein